MPIAESARLSASAIIAVIAALLGFAAFWANPRRNVNRGFFVASLSVAWWLICIDQVRRSEAGAVFWARMAGFAGGAIFFPIWFIKEAIVRGDDGALGIIFRGRYLLLSCVVLGSVRWFNFFVGPLNVSAIIFIVGLFLLYTGLFVQTWREISVQSGVKRLELKIVLLGGCATGLAIMLLLVVRRAADLPWVVQAFPLVVFLFYTGTVVAMTTSRIFDARQIVLFVIQKLILLLGAAGLGYGVYVAMDIMLEGPLVGIATVGIVLWAASLFGVQLDRLFEFYPQANSARQAILAAAQREKKIESMVSAFRAILVGWGNAEKAVVMSGNTQILSEDGFVLSGESPVVKALRVLKWASPERLERERATADRRELAQFMYDRELAVVAFVDGYSLSVLVGVGANAARRPYTFPQITQLIELASIMESALERVHFSSKVQHAEQLATVGLLGASVAHEIRNPLVSIKTFVQLLPTHHQDPRFREKFFKLIGDEVTRIDQLTEQLLDLASPRTYSATVLELHPVLRSSLELVAAKAGQKQVQLHTELRADPDRAFTDAAAAKQVLLNLCFNAIQAVEALPVESRWIKVATRNTDRGIEMAVSDNGAGIPPEIRPKLFQPFQTTKSSGFGLGLAICSDILANLNAAISVDPTEPGRGATFRVIFPCQPSSS